MHATTALIVARSVLAACRIIVNLEPWQTGNSKFLATAPYAITIEWKIGQTQRNMS